MKMFDDIVEHDEIEDLSHAGERLRALPFVDRQACRARELTDLLPEIVVLEQRILKVIGDGASVAKHLQDHRLVADAASEIENLRTGGKESLHRGHHMLVSAAV